MGIGHPNCDVLSSDNDLEEDLSIGFRLPYEVSRRQAHDQELVCQ